MNRFKIFLLCLIPQKGFLVKAGGVFIASFFLCCRFVSSASGLDVPDYRGYVNDYADMISPEMERRLERTLQSFDLSDSTQVVILTLNSLEGAF